MSFSLSAVDAELAELCPTELAERIAQLTFAALTLPLAEVDALLAALGHASMPPPRPGEFARATPANDVAAPRRPSVLPVRSSVPSIPRMSIQAPSAPLPPTRRDLSPVRAAARQSAVAAQTDATAGSFVRAREEPKKPASEPTPEFKTEVMPPSSQALRDADAEFDALLSDATSPHGLPARKLLNQPASEAELKLPPLDDDAAVLDAVVGDTRPSQPTPDQALRGASAEASIDVPLDGDDATDVFDQETYAQITASLPPSADDELDLSEFELELDGDEVSDTEQGVPKPPPVPNAARGSVPHEPAPEKRPSFLGRLFSRRDGEGE